MRQQKVTCIRKELILFAPASEIELHFHILFQVVEEQIPLDWNVFVCWFYFISFTFGGFCTRILYVRL